MISQLSGCRVLVVEDETIVSWAIEDMLADLGCEVVGPAARLSQALAIVDSGNIDLAILDVNLNGQKSFPIADALAARGVPFLFSTGYGSEGILDPYNVYPTIQKPYGQTVLCAALERLLARKQSS
jgi:CheY-like chemotaxis protein